MSNVYLVLNETTFHGTDAVTTEVTAVYDNLQGAMDEIQGIAEDAQVYVEPDADSVVLSGEYGTGIDTDEYYIAEMELKSNG